MTSPARRQVVVVGAGGHAKVVIELLQASAEGFDVMGLVDADPAPRLVLGLPVIGDDSHLPRLRSQGIEAAFVAIGDNRRRSNLADKVREHGFGLVNAIGAGAVISPSARLGRGIAVMNGAVINAEAQVDDLTIINTGVLVDHDVRLHAGAHLGPGCALAGGVEVGARAFLGVGVTAVPGVRIGADTVVGAGACVVNNLPSGVLALGVPARVIRPLDSSEMDR